MRIAVALAITLGAFALSPVFAASAEPAETVHHQYQHHQHTHHHPVHGAGRPAPAVVAPEAVAPQTPGVRRGQTDGLSRDEEDCDMGCVGGNPN